MTASTAAANALVRAPRYPGHADIRVFTVLAIEVLIPDFATLHPGYARFPAGAIPTVDFLLYHRAPFVKKPRVKSHVADHSSHSFTLLFTSFGSVRPSLSSADRLTEKVNSVGTSTGNPPGLAPRKIAPMYLAAAISPCR